MADKNEEHRNFHCEGRSYRWRYFEGEDREYFRSRSQEIPHRDISMMIPRNGTMYHAQASIQIEGEGTAEWMAVAIAVLDMSVNMAITSE